MSRVPVAVVGATGLAGQEFLAALGAHPMFKVAKVAASSRSAGKKLRDAVKDDRGASKWFCSDPLPEETAELVVEDSANLSADGVGLVFSAVEADVAREIEPRMAAHLPVISTASAFRYEADVPVFLPGVNWDHAALIDVQRRRRGWKGFITPGPNCTTVGLAMTLRPLDIAFGIERVHHDLDAGDFGRRAVARGVGHGRPRQHHSLHSQGGGEGPERDPEDPGQAQRRDHHAGSLLGLLHLHPGQRPGGPHRIGVRAAAAPGAPGRRQGGVARVRRGPSVARAALGARRLSRSTTIPSARRSGWTATRREA